MTDFERLWRACGVLNKHKHLESSKWFVTTLGFKWFAVNLNGDEKLLAFEATAIAIALDERARRKLPDPDQIDWACSVLNQRRHGGHARWNTMKGYDGWLVFHLDREYSFFDALAIAESLVRREMLGDTSDANSKGVKS